MTFMKAFEGQLYALLRIVAGFMFLWHGVAKLFAFPEFQEMPSFVRYGAGPIELVGGALVMLGLFTRPAAFLASGQMAAAYFIGHQARGLLPIQNGGDLAVLYCFVFLFISAKGPGQWSVDRG
jgi:putative oxidoreductase